MDIRQSKNFNTGTFNTEGGNAHLGDNFYKSLEYKELTERIEEMRDFMQSTTDEVKRLKYSQKLNELQTQLDAFKRDIIQLAETFQKIDIDTDRLRLAKQHFDNGEYKAARAVLDAEQMTGELDALLAEKEKLSEKTVRNAENLYDKAEEFLILAKLTAINYNLPNRFEKAKEYFEKSLQADKNPINLTSFSMFLHEHNKLDYAAENYEDLLTLIEDLKDINLSYLNDKGLTLNNLGMIYRKLGKFEQSIKCYEEAIEIGKKGESSNNKLLLSVLSLALFNFGVLQDDLGNYENAITLYKDSFKLKANFQPESKHSQAQTLMNLGIVYSKKNQINESEEYYQKAKSIAENLIIQNETDENLSLLGDILLNYGQLKLKNKDFGSADKYNSLCLSIFEQLAASNPYVHIERVASAKSNLAVIKRNTNKLVEAKQLYLGAYDIYAKLSTEFPKSYSPMLATVSNNIALFYGDLKEFDEAIKFHQEALNVRRKLFSQNAEVYAADLSQSLLNISLYYERIRNRGKAIDFMLEAVQILVPLSEKIPFTRKHLSNALRVLSQWGVTPQIHNRKVQ